MTLQSLRLIGVSVSLLACVACQRNDDRVTPGFDKTPAISGIIRIDAQEQQRLGIMLAPVRNETVRATISAVGWLMAPAAAETVIRAPVAGFAMPSSSQPWPALGQEISSHASIAQVNVFLSPQEVSQLVQAKEDNDIQMQQSLVTMELSEAQLKLVTSARDAVTGVRIDQLREAFERSKVAYKQAQEKVPFLIQEPYDNEVLVKPVRIDAPHAGQILQVHCAAGQFVQVGDALWTVADWSTLWLRVPVFDGDLQRIDPAQSAEIRDRGNQNWQTAEPMAVPTEMKPGTRTVDLFYKLANPDWRLRAGQSMAVALPTADDQRALLIPRSAVLYDGFGQTSCYVANEDRAQFARRRIELGSRQTDLVVVGRGLAADDVVVSTGAEQFAAEESKAELNVEDDD